MEQISSRTHSHSQQGAECDSSVVGAPVQTLSSEPTRCCIQVLTVTVKPQLLELVNQLQAQVTVGTDCFRSMKMSGRGSGGGRSGSWGGGRSGGDDQVSQSQSREAQEQKERNLTRQVDEKRDHYQ